MHCATACPSEWRWHGATARRARAGREIGQRTPLAHPGRVDFQQLSGSAAEVFAYRSVVRAVRIEPDLPAFGTVTRIRMLAEHPHAHGPDAAIAVEARAAFDPAFFVACRQDVSRVRILRVDLAPQAEIRIVRERIEELERRQAVVAEFDLPQQRHAVVGSRITARLVAIDRVKPENPQRFVNRRRTGLVEVDREDLAGDQAASCPDSALASFCRRRPARAQGPAASIATAHRPVRAVAAPGCAHC